MQIVSKGLKFTYNKKTEFKSNALKDITLTIEEGDFFGIIGQTGSGKSTFIQHLNGLIQTESGELYVGKYNLSAGVKNDGKTLKELRSKIGMVFQYPEYQLFADTVFEDVAFGLKNFFPTLSEEEVALRVKSALEAVGLNYFEIKDRSPFELSGGQKRRVAIAGVLVSEPEVLVLDEPVAGLDPVGKRQLMELLHQIHGQSVKTIIIVSHDMDEVCENCSRVAVFSSGETIFVDMPSNLFSKYDFVESNRLELPLTAKVAKSLKDIGIDLDTDYKTDNLIVRVEKAYKN